MEVRQINLREPGQVRAFIRLPYQLYAGDSHWVPNLRREMKAVMNPATYPFYQHGRAAFFLAEQDGKIVGRLAAINNHRYNRYNETKTGFFHYFECVDDTRAARTLFEAAFEWMQQEGLTEVLGPKGLLQGDAAGMLIEGFDWRPAMGVAYNPPYYQSLLESAGFEKATDYLSGFINDINVLPARLEKIAQWVKKRRGYSVQEFQSKDQLWDWVPRIKEVYNQSFAEAFPGPIHFTPLSEAEIQTIASRLIALTEPELVKLVLDGNQLVGFLFAYPNIGPALRRAGGRLWPLGWLHILWEKRTTRWLDANGSGVLPQYQGSGASAVLYSELAKAVDGTRFSHADAVQVREENLKSKRDAETLGVQWYKRHRLFYRQLDG